MATGQPEQLRKESQPRAGNVYAKPGREKTNKSPTVYPPPMRKVKYKMAIES